MLLGGCARAGGSDEATLTPAGKAEPSLPVAPPSASLDSYSPPSQRGNLSAWGLLESVHLCSRLTVLHP